MLSLVAAATVTGCSSDESAVCISNDIGDVCADESNAAITFRASGMAPRSEVEVLGPEEQSFILQIDGDGTYAPPARSVGFLYAFDNTELTFIVTATDSHGELLGGDIVISTRSREQISVHRYDLSPTPGRGRDYVVPQWGRSRTRTRGNAPRL